MVSPSNENENENSGVWIGIDLGTSNSACAVWDSTRGSSKWMRLPDIAVHEGSSSSSKWGRLVPSVVKLSSSRRRPPLVGAQALDVTTGTLISSVKRLLGRRLADLDAHWVESSLPFDVIEDDHGELKLVVESCSDTDEDTTSRREELTPVQVLGILLKGMLDAAQVYLKKYALKKRLDVPGASEGGSFLIRNAVIGVPAHFSKRQIALVEQAARLAGLEGTISTCLESTAAAMAYGLTLQETSDDANIMVIDMGGGTSDITVACKTRRGNNNDSDHDGENDDDLVVSSASASSYQVLVTTGEERLGGDDIDQAMVDYCMEKMFQSPNSLSFKSKRAISSKVLQSCRKAKEKLCDLESPSESETIRIDGKAIDKSSMKEAGAPLSVEIDLNQFEKILKPWLDKARGLIRRAIEQFDEVSSDSTKISEVILVGGTTRVPAIRRMIQKEFFPNIEIGTSLNPMSSVAQGLAIHAALVSRLVPEHQLRSALMLDCIPHAIGVLMGDPKGENPGNFIEILKRNAPLPAKGSSTFTLADKLQPGVTIRAVEKVGQKTNGDPLYEDIAKEPFTFLLRRLPNEQFVELTHRSIEVGMKVDKDGSFTVSIFDEMDPEQVRKRERFEKEGQIIGFQEVGLRRMFHIFWEDANFASTDQFVLIGLLVATLVLYIVTKLVFNEDLLLVVPSDI